MFHANPVRGAMFLNEGFLKISPPVTKFDDCRSGSAEDFPSTSCGSVMNSYRTPRFTVTLRAADQSSCA